MDRRRGATNGSVTVTRRNAEANLRSLKAPPLFLCAKRVAICPLTGLGVSGSGTAPPASLTVLSGPPSSLAQSKREDHGFREAFRPPQGIPASGPDHCCPRR